MITERGETLPETALRVEVREEEEQPNDEDEARYDGPLDDITGLQTVSYETVAWTETQGRTNARVPPGPGDAVVVAHPAVGEVIRVVVALAGIEHHRCSCR